YTGLSLEESIGHGWLRAVHPDDRQKAQSAWQESVVHETEFNDDYRLRSKDGQYRWFKSWGVPMRTAAGQVVNWFGACTDIDDVLRAREVLAHSHELLERTVRERTAKL